MPRIRLRPILALLVIAIGALALACSSGRPQSSPTAISDAPASSPSPEPTTRAPFVPGQTPTSSATPDLARSRAVVDEVIAAVETGNVDALEALMRYQQVPCDGEKAFTGPPYPDCDGSELGTLVPAAAIGVCNAVWHRDATPLVARFIDRAGPLFAVLKGPAPAFEYDGGIPVEARPWDFRVVFRSTATGEERGAVAVVEDGAVGLLVLGCGDPGWELLFQDSPVTVELTGGRFVAPTPFPTPPATPAGAPDAPVGTRTGLAVVDRALEGIRRMTWRR